MVFFCLNAGAHGPCHDKFQGDSMTARIHQEQTFAASPGDIFTALTLAAEFSAMTGAPAQIDPGIAQQNFTRTGIGGT
jgi:hypothetical protein